MQPEDLGNLKEIMITFLKCENVREIIDLMDFFRESINKKGLSENT